jgi:hypothetical protein
MPLFLRVEFVFFASRENPKGAWIRFDNERTNPFKKTLSKMGAPQGVAQPLPVGAGL